MEILHRLVRFRVNHDCLELIDGNSKSTSDPTYTVNAELIFATEFGFLGFTRAGLRLGLKKFYPTLCFPITVGDCIASSHLFDVLYYTNDDDLDFPLVPLNKIWTAYPSVTNASEREINFRFKELGAYFNPRNWSLYFLKHTYLRFCQITGCPYNRIMLDTLRKSWPFMPFWCTFSYEAPEHRIIYAFLAKSELTSALFPEDFRIEHPKYFLDIPVEEVDLILNDYLGLRYGMAFLRR